jgi:hypothetical protein
MTGIFNASVFDIPVYSLQGSESSNFFLVFCELEFFCFIAVKLILIVFFLISLGDYFSLSYLNLINRDLFIYVDVSSDLAKKLRLKKTECTYK